MSINDQEIYQAQCKWGLVLEGGAMRGLFTAGIIDVMMENNISPDGLIGVSAGAAFGCNFKSRQAGRCLRYNKKYAKDWRYCSLRSLLTTGDIFGGDFCYHYLPQHPDTFDTKTFDENPMKFYAVCTDVDTGKAVYKQLEKASHECYEWIRASASMPIVSRIVNINGQQLLDGGIADSIPLQQFQRMGYHRNIVVLTQPRNFVKQRGKTEKAIAFALRKHPRFVETSNNRHHVCNQTLAYIREQETIGNTLVLAPEDKLPIGHISHDPEQMQRVYDMGRHAAETRLEEMKTFIAK